MEGTINLDAETSEDPLDFFVTFSSLAASFGNVGQADYAAANRFMETFGESRKGPGRTLAIGWTFWKDGGLAARDADDRALQEATGLRWIDAEEGVVAFERALATQGRVLLVIAGEKGRIGRFLDARPAGPAPSEPQEVTAPETAVGNAHEAALAYWKGLLSRSTGVPERRIDPERPLEHYGIDSMLVSRINADLERDFGRLSKTLLYEHQTLGALADHFAARHASRLLELTGKGVEQPARSETPVGAADRWSSQASKRSLLPS